MMRTTLLFFQNSGLLFETDSHITFLQNQDFLKKIPGRRR